MFQFLWRSITLVTTSQIKAYRRRGQVSMGHNLQTQITLNSYFQWDSTSVEALDCLGNESIEPAPKLGQRNNRAPNGRPIPMPRTSPTISA